jgi:hypothetical protein
LADASVALPHDDGVVEPPAGEHRARAATAGARGWQPEPRTFV